MINHFYENSAKADFDYQAIYTEMIQLAPDPAHFVEVGCHLGGSSSYMVVEIVNSRKKIQFDCVDPWDNVPHINQDHLEHLCAIQNKTIDQFRIDSPEYFYNNSIEMFHGNMKPLKGYYNAIQAYSPNICKEYADNSLDFVWIDALHTYDGVFKDINGWLPKVKSGGWIGGHDYDGETRRAVDELISGVAEKTSSHCSSWLYQKP